MSDLSREDILATLATVTLPDGRALTDSSMISGLVVRHGKVGFALDAGGFDNPAALEPVREKAEKAVLAVPGVKAATVVLTAERPMQSQQAEQSRPAAAAPQKGRGGAAEPLPDVRKVIAVASGKGGVGKSTVAVNLALGLARLGQRVGLLDADIYGPSIPRMLGLHDKPETKNRKLVPPVPYGIKAMSIGLLVPQDQAMIWRGAMVVQALTQMMSDVAWGELDVLVVDMPPGTGDAQLTMAQRVPLAGAVVVSTPQDVALIDARKGIAMFEKTNVPVLGLIENMSTFICPHCGERSDIFGHGGARRTADDFGVPFLGEVPLHLRIRELSDAGTPVVASDPNHALAQSYIDIAATVLGRLSDDTVGRQPPEIVIE